MKLHLHYSSNYSSQPLICGCAMGLSKWTSDIASPTDVWVTYAAAVDTWADIADAAVILIYSKTLGTT
jgi:hypothetical protein